MADEQHQAAPAAAGAVGMAATEEGETAAANGDVGAGRRAVFGYCRELLLESVDSATGVTTNWVTPKPS